MSEENVKTVRRAVEAFNRGDLDSALELMHPDIEWKTPDSFPDAATYRGREEVREFWKTWRDTFRGFRLDLEECVPVGEDHVLAYLRVSGEGSGSGVGVKSPVVFQLGEIRAGQVIWVGMFLSESDALEAAGLRE
jgi:ketosteroid isomerase-like protein